MLSCPSLKTADGASFTSPDHMLSDNDDGFGQNEGQSQRSMFLCVCVGSPSHNLVPGVEERFRKDCGVDKVLKQSSMTKYLGM